MLTTHSRRPRPSRRLYALVAVVSLAFGMAACGSDDDTGSGDSMPSTIRLVSTTDLTGVAAFAGSSQLDGAKLAVSEINDQGFLGSSKIELASKDTAGSVQTASSLVSQAIADKGVAAILGTVSGDQSLAVGPLAQRGKTPIVFTVSGSPGTVVGDYTFRVTAPQTTYYSAAMKYVTDNGAKKVAVIYDSSAPTFQKMADETIPDAAKSLGFDVVTKTAVTTTTQDFSAPVQKALASNPDTVCVLLIGAANATAVTELRQAGFKGQIVGSQGSGAGNLKAAGSAAAGVVYATDFIASNSDPATQKFVSAYKSMFDGKEPNNYAAEGYDAMWMIARAIKASGSATRSGIQKGLDQVAEEGFDGVLGKLTFEDRDLRIDGIVVKWDGTKEELATQ